MKYIEIDYQLSFKYNIGRYGNNGMFIHDFNGNRAKIFNDKKTDIENWNDAVEWAEANFYLFL